MDPATLIVAALVAGLTAGLTDVAKAAVTDTYTLFRDRLNNKVTVRQEAQEALRGVERRPDSKGWQEDLQRELSALEVGKDGELVRLAQAVLNELDPPGVRAGKYHVTITGSRNIVVGDRAKVDQKAGADLNSN